MVKKIEQGKAKGYLGDVNSDVVFWASDGGVIKNLRDLPKAIRSMKNEQFTHHVNKEKNDFSNWISDIVGDKVLAKSISKLKSKDTLLKKLNLRINALKRIAG